MGSPYLITKLRVEGEGMETAAIDFLKGVNVIVGPSDTGKTYIFDCINFVFGSRESPKEIEEAKYYSSVFLEIQLNDGRLYTLKRRLEGGSLELFQVGYDELTFSEESTTLSQVHSATNNNCVSVFFLTLNNLNNLHIRKNAQGITRSLSFRDIIKFSLIDELRIITSESMLYVRPTDKSVGRSTLKLLATGHGDENSQNLLSADQIQFKKGQLHHLDHEILELSTELNAYSPEELENSDLMELLVDIDELKDNYSILINDQRSLEKKKKVIESILGTLITEKSVFSELLKRSSVLRKHYLSDIGRLRATIEASSLMNDTNTDKYLCPLCNSQIEHECEPLKIELVISACSKEIDKIEDLIAELDQSVVTIEENISKLDRRIENVETDRNEIIDEIENFLSDKLDEVRMKIEGLNEKRSFFLGINDKAERLKALQSKKDNLQSHIENARREDTSTKLSYALIKDILDILENILKAVDYEGLSGVSFDEDQDDIIISGKNRRTFGKGYRSIFYSAFIIALHKYVETKEYGIGVPVLDSPFTTYSPAEDSLEDKTEKNYSQDFYRYLANEALLNQIIIIENEAPPSDSLNQINLIKFTQSVSEGRFGFFPS